MNMLNLFPLLKVAGFTEVDGTILFYNAVNALLKPGDVLLDYGAGRGCAGDDPNEWRRGLAATQLLPIKRIAVDVDPAVLQNPFADQKLLLGPDFSIPLGDESVDLVLVDWVVEHLPDPEATFRECRRVLKSGGHLCIRTSNFAHYVYLGASLLKGGRLEEWLLRRLQPEREAQDVFPKLYRCNSRRAFRNCSSRAGFDDATTLTWDAEPAYVGKSKLLSIMGFLYHRIAAAGLLPRATLMGFAKK